MPVIAGALAWLLLGEQPGWQRSGGLRRDRRRRAVAGVGLVGVGRSRSASRRRPAAVRLRTMGLLHPTYPAQRADRGAGRRPDLHPTPRLRGPAAIPAAGPVPHGAGALDRDPAASRISGRAGQRRVPDRVQPRGGPAGTGPGRRHGLAGPGGGNACWPSRCWEKCPRCRPRWRRAASRWACSWSARHGSSKLPPGRRVDKRSAIHHRSQPTPADFAKTRIPWAPDSA